VLVTPPLESAMNPSLHFRIRAITGAVALGLVTAAAACRDSAAPTEQMATFTGRWAGQPWAGDGSASIARGGAAGDTLYVFGVHRTDGWRDPDQYVRVRAVVSAPGTYALSADAAEVMDLVGGDLVTSVYAGSRPGAGTLYITTYDGLGGVVEGTFSFEAQPDRTSAPYGSLARFEDGWFRVTIPRSR